MSSRGASRTLLNARVVTCEPTSENPYGLLPELSAIVVRDGVIEKISAMSTLSKAAAGDGIDLKGKLVTPGLIDCHTHLVFAGNRSAEWEMRLQGKSYEEIARAGGGILSTVRATRKASEAELLDLARSRLQSLTREGVTCVEIKSGYGLTSADEIKILRVIKKLRDENRVEISPTLLAAHAVAPEFVGDSDGYVRLIEEEILPQVAKEGLVEAVDVFC